MDITPKCPKCSGEMKEGFVVDYRYSTRFVATWIAGPPEYSILGNLKDFDKEQRPIRTFCCQSCGYLESYANRQ
jgi:predicted nucleic-acid-binding Zn-ribbon protein